MKTRLWITMVAAMIAVAIGSVDIAFGIGGRGGGGGERALGRETGRHLESVEPGGQFQLDIAKDGGFVWTYSRGKDKQSMQGVFAVDQNNLALEPDSGGTMLAEGDITNPSQFLFKMIGGDAKDPGLQFKKS